MKSKGIISNTKKLVKTFHKMCPSYFPLAGLQKIFQEGRPFLSMYLGARIVDGIVEKRAEQEIIRTALCMVSLCMFLALTQWAIDKILIIKQREVEEKMHVAFACKSLTMDYQVMEKAETRDYLIRINEGSNFGGGITQFCKSFLEHISAMVAILYAAFPLAALFRSRVSEKGQGIARWIDSWYAPLLFLGLMAGIVLYHFYLYSKINGISGGDFEVGVHLNRRAHYIGRYVTEYSFGKAARIYDTMGLVIGQMKAMQAETAGHWQRSEKKRTVCRSQGIAAMGAGMVASYLYVGGKAVCGAISIGELTFYVGVLTMLYRTLCDLAEVSSEMGVMSRYLVDYIDYLNLTNEKYDGTLPIEKRLDYDYELEFKNVSFHYPNSDIPVLKNISMKIPIGRKMAIVGKNGSGKSTFIKLLCRLYDPTEGGILLNGIDIRKYDYEEYRQIFGVVFQDFQLFSFPVAQNVAAGVDYEVDKVWKALGQAGMAERVRRMEKGLETVIYKQEEEGVEISGGEAQKLAIARALYKDAPVVILDEPTAALDPAAEAEIYERLDGMVGDKTAIYISHRMASCRFCENILVFEDGEIVQMGAHEELMEQGGVYAKLWAAQAQYYQERG